MKILISGAGGQVGFELQKTVPPEYHIMAVTRSELDITDVGAVEETVSQYKPDLIINTAAYTHVDKAEENVDLAYSVNATGAANIARCAYQNQARVIHISTDFVFDGESAHPYKADDSTCPVNIYGKSKREGELRILESTAGSALIIRTGWVYSVHGTNFVKTILRLLAERDKLNVVDDQIGTPSWAQDLAKIIWEFATKPEICGIYHWTNSGVASWYDFAIAIQNKALQIGLLTKATPIYPIDTAGYPTPASRPANSVLDKTATWNVLQHKSTHWGQGLTEMLHQLKTSAV